jgi:macrodomain Ter protein organizer (MatP/YcbG family)
MWLRRKIVTVRDKRKKLAVTTKATVKLDPDVHAWLVLLAEKHDTTLSGAIHMLIAEHEPDIIRLQTEIDALKQRHLSEK